MRASRCLSVAMILAWTVGSAGAASRRQQCLVDCAALIQACTSACGPFAVRVGAACPKGILQRCRKEGLAVCATTTTTSTPPTSTSSTTVTTTTLPACAPTCFPYGGSNWFLASGPTVSCDTTCASHTLTCDAAATRDVAGSGGTLMTCQAITAGLVPAGAPHAGVDFDNAGCGTADAGTGCVFRAADVIPATPAAAIRITAPVTTCAATGVSGACSPQYARVCACH